MSKVPLRIPRQTERDVYARFERFCFRHQGPYKAWGREIHHRMRRQAGGHILSNLVLLCSACHLEVHDQPEQSRLDGWIIPANSRITPADIATIPVWKPSAGYFLLPDFSNQPNKPQPVGVEFARHRLAMYGLTNGATV